MPSDPSLLAFIQSLPKTETHLHLEGALPFELLQRVRPEFTQPPASWAHNFKFRDFGHFEKELLDMAFLWFTSPERSEEHTSELQSPDHLVCRLLLEKKNHTTRPDSTVERVVH